MSNRTVTLTEVEWSTVIAMLALRGEKGSAVADKLAAEIEAQVKDQGSNPFGVDATPATPVREVPRTSKEVHGGLEVPHEFSGGYVDSCYLCGKHASHHYHKKKDR
jgi:hypothetical protein